MGRWLRRARAMLVMGLFWAGGGFAIGGLIELVANVMPGGWAFASRVDIWPQTLAIPGFIGGVLFAGLLLAAGSRPRFQGLSLATFATFGAVAGVLLGGIGMTIGAPLGFVAITAATGAVGGALSLAFARIAERRGAIVAGAEARKLRERAPDEA